MSSSLAFPTGKPARLRFTGYAALFDVADRGGDIIRRGAFDGAGAPIPLLWQHDPKRRIGTVDSLSEDGLGLKIDASVDGASGAAREVAAMLNEGRINGLSFGYRVRAASAGAPGRGGAKVRELTALDLVEVSLVTNPMQPGARVTHII
ncbi:MAG: HK97 family phage prohead protease [Sphingopyxis sp.]